MHVYARGYGTCICLWVAPTMCYLDLRLISTFFTMMIRFLWGGGGVYDCLTPYNCSCEKALTPSKRTVIGMGFFPHRPVASMRQTRQPPCFFHIFLILYLSTNFFQKLRFLRKFGSDTDLASSDFLPWLRACPIYLSRRSSLYNLSLTKKSLKYMGLTKFSGSSRN